MARNYTILGERDKAAKSMRIAAALMPNHRYVVRAAARLAVHHGEFDRAHSMVARCARTPGDPWLLATELATAGPAEMRPRFARRGRAMLEGGEFPLSSISELASALGTLELRDGSGRRGRTFIQRSLEDPNDNTIAQGQWLSKQIPSLEINDSLLGESAEARALRYGTAMESEEALSAAWDWHYDQPFASGPGELGSYHASVAGRFEEGAAISRAALRANPGEFLLSNNLAFCLLKLDRVQEAGDTLQPVSTDNLDADQRATYMATLGLLYFRAGDADRGRRLYLQAIERSRGQNHRALAKINLAVEEYRVGNFDEAEKLIDEVLASVPIEDPELTAWLRRLPMQRN
jgi:tetratricopeptide (TPR) repeat protein